MTIHLHKNDLPADVTFSGRVAVDSETLGLNLKRDPLCLVQLSSGDGEAHIVQLDRATYDAPNLKALMTNPDIVKIFHFARFDVAILKACLDVDTAPIYCTRTASKLIRTYTDRHGLRDNCRELLGIDLNKQMQSSDWGAAELTKEQLSYAANDVLYLHQLQDKLDVMLNRENRMELAQKCFEVISVQAELDLAGWAGHDLFAH